MAMEILKNASLVLIFLVCLEAHPLKFEDRKDSICESSDDYYNSNDEDIKDVLDALRPMLQILSTKLDRLKDLFVRTFLHEEEICHTPDEYVFSLTMDSLGSNDSFENSGEIGRSQSLVHLYSNLVRMYDLVQELLPEYEISMKDHFWELIYHSECGIAGMICFSESYVPLEVRQKASRANITLPFPGNKVEHLCRDLHIIKSFQKSTSTWLEFI